MPVNSLFSLSLFLWFHSTQPLVHTSDFSTVSFGIYLSPFDCTQLNEYQFALRRRPPARSTRRGRGGVLVSQRTSHSKGLLQINVFWAFFGSSAMRLLRSKQGASPTPPSRMVAERTVQRDTDQGDLVTVNDGDGVAHTDPRLRQ